MIIDDDFISNHQKSFIENTILSSDFKWEYVKATANKNLKNSFPDENTLDSFQFSHLFCSYNEKKSDFYDVAMDLFNPFLKKHSITKRNIIRGKCNLVLRPDNLTIPESRPQKYMMPHIDNSFDDSIFLYYVNESDGDTILFDRINRDIKPRERVSPHKGRAIFFNGGIVHAPEYPFKYRERVVINICFN
jgi:hypothetical protein